MINEKEVNAIKGLMHYLNTNGENRAIDLAFDVKVIDPNGETLCRIERIGEDDYQLLFGES